MNRSRYNKIASAVYERIAETGEKFDIEDVIDEIVRELSSETATAELIHEFASTLAAKADDKAASRVDSGQLNLLTGDEVALDAVWRLGGGQRVKARQARRPDVIAWFEQRSANFSRVTAAFEADQKVTAELLVYMPDETTTVEAAVTARHKAQAGGQK